MKFWITGFGCALALALALPMGNEAKADGYYAPVRAYAPVFTRKLCTPPPSRFFWDRGAPATWICAASEKCCYDKLFRKGTCVAATDRCF